MYLINRQSVFGVKESILLFLNHFFQHLSLLIAVPVFRSLLIWLAGRPRPIAGQGEKNEKIQLQAPEEVNQLIRIRAAYFYIKKRKTPESLAQGI